MSYTSAVVTPGGQDSEYYSGEVVGYRQPEHYPTVPVPPPTYSAPAPPPAANWYPDPQSPGILRYWDGVRWTEHRSAATPTATATVYNNVNVRGGGSDAGVHLILTILTCGLWIPVWIIIEIIKSISSN
uniref:DUF2510 domain-containing protein n=8 Tax=unclassified Caudoviricetes TaxID=2788787 RepID=A0AB39U1Q0_9CAUD